MSEKEMRVLGMLNMLAIWRIEVDHCNDDFAL